MYTNYIQMKKICTQANLRHHALVSIRLHNMHRFDLHISHCAHVKKQKESEGEGLAARSHSH